MASATKNIEKVEVMTTVDKTNYVLNMTEGEARTLRNIISHVSVGNRAEHDNVIEIILALQSVGITYVHSERAAYGFKEY